MNVAYNAPNIGNTMVDEANEILKLVKTMVDGKIET